MKKTNVLKFLTFLSLMGIIYGCGHDNGDGLNNAINSIKGSTEPTTVTNTAASPAEMNVGDVFSITFDKGNPSLIDFSDVDVSAQFVLAISAIDAGQTAHSVQMTDENASFDISDEVQNIDVGKGAGSPDAAETFEQQLRNAEAEMSEDNSLTKVQTAQNVGKAASSAAIDYAVGDEESFHVLASVSSLSSYKTIRAKIKCVGENVVFYVDDEVAQKNPDDLTDADVLALCEDFDAMIYREFELFGEPSDVNNDGRFAVLMTPQVNRLGAAGGGIITGFFYANDLYSNINSNMREMVYVHVPDVNGLYGVTIPKAFAMDNLLPSVLPHELQHAINYNNKVFVNDGTSEENWLNEALSHFSEDVLGVGMENPSRIEVYLSNPSYYGPISSGSPSLAERAASYLFLRFLYEQADDPKAFVWNLIHSNYKGVENIEYSFNGQQDDFNQISEFLLRWNIAVVMSSFDLSTDPAFSYKERVKNAQTQNWEGVCLDCIAEDGRGTILSGVQLSQFYSVNSISLEPSASKFYKVTSFPMNLDFGTKTAGTYAASLVRYK